jgi:hypothetical protein
MKINSTTVIDHETATKHVFLYVDVDAEEIAKKIQKLMNKGGVLIHVDGSREWHEWEQIVDTTKSGSEQYTWDKTGNKVLCQLVRHHTMNGLAMKKQIIRKRFRKFE